MSAEDKKGECCKGFEDSACPCLDQETGERSCKPKTDEKDKGCCGTDNSCCGPKQP